MSKKLSPEIPQNEDEAFEMIELAVEDIEALAEAFRLMGELDDEELGDIELKDDEAEILWQ
jgi:hypothetical protein